MIASQTGGIDASASDSLRFLMHQIEQHVTSQFSLSRARTSGTAASRVGSAVLPRRLGTVGQGSSKALPERLPALGTNPTLQGTLPGGSPTPVPLLRPIPPLQQHMAVQLAGNSIGNPTGAPGWPAMTQG